MHTDTHTYARMHTPMHTHTHMLKRRKLKGFGCAYLCAHMYKHTHPFSFSSFIQPVIVERNDNLHLLQKFKLKNVMYKNHQPSGREKKILEAF